jgi:hypothetical protein
MYLLDGGIGRSSSSGRGGGGERKENCKKFARSAEKDFG